MIIGTGNRASHSYPYGVFRPAGAVFCPGFRVRDRRAGYGVGVALASVLTRWCGEKGGRGANPFLCATDS
jgi:hypothetical protein